MLSPKKISPNVWQQRRAPFEHTLPSGQKILMRVLDPIEMFEHNILPQNMLSNFTKLTEQAKTKEDIVKELKPENVIEMLKMARSMAIISVIEPALTSEPEKEPGKFPIDYVDKIDLFDIMKMSMPSIQQSAGFFRNAGQDSADSRNGGDIRAETEHVHKGDLAGT